MESSARRGIRLYRAFVETISPELSAFGFAKQPSKIFHADLQENPRVAGVVAFLQGVADVDGSQLIAPTVGVRHERLETLWARLSPATRPGRLMATTTRNIGYLMPVESYMRWSIEPGANLYEIAEDVAGAIEEYGLPHMSQLVDPEALVDAVRADAGHEYKLPLALLLVGDLNEAEETVSCELSSLGGECHEGANLYREFAAAFFDHTGRPHDLSRPNRAT